MSEQQYIEWAHQVNAHQVLLQQENKQLKQELELLQRQMDILERRQDRMFEWITQIKLKKE